MDKCHKAGITRHVMRNVWVGDRRTSMRLEPELWDALADIAKRTGRSLGELVADAERVHVRGGRTSAVRVFLVTYWREAALAAEPFVLWVNKELV